jgi:hypothetical protein
MISLPLLDLLKEFRFVQVELLAYDGNPHHHKAFECPLGRQAVLHRPEGETQLIFGKPAHGGPVGFRELNRNLQMVDHSVTSLAAGLGRSPRGTLPFGLRPKCNVARRAASCRSVQAGTVVHWSAGLPIFTRDGR